MPSRSARRTCCAIRSSEPRISKRSERRSTEPWLNKLDGPAPELKRVRVGGTDYLMASACKAHDCADNNTVLLYSKQNGAVYGKVFERRRASLIGNPPAAVAARVLG